MNRLFLLLCFSLSIVTTKLEAQADNVTSELFQKNYENLKELAISRTYSFKANLIFDGSQRALNNTVLTINKKSLNGQLEMFPKDSNQVSFKNSRIENYNLLTNDDKQIVIITFNSSNAEGSHLFEIKLMPNGKAFMTISNSQQIDIEFIGSLEKL